MAGRHGVPDPERRSHARVARRQRRRRLQRRDAAQPWAAWLLLRVGLGLVVVAASTWSVLLLRRGQGGIWPLVAVAAGGLSLLLIGLDIAARHRQRRALRVPSVARLAADGRALPSVAEPPRDYRGAHHYLDELVEQGSPGEPGDGADGAAESSAGPPDPPAPTLPEQPRPGRHSHRR